MDNTTNTDTPLSTNAVKTEAAVSVLRLLSVGAIPFVRSALHSWTTAHAISEEIKYLNKVPTILENANKYKEEHAPTMEYSATAKANMAKFERRREE